MLQRAKLRERETALPDSLGGREGKGGFGGHEGAWGWGCGSHGISTEQARAKNEPKMSSK